MVVCDRGLDMYTKMRRGMRRTRQCRVLYFEVHCDFNAAERVMNPPVIAPVTPPVRSQADRPAPSTPEKLPEPGLRQGVVRAEVKPEQVPKAYMAPRERVAKQQQDWRLIFVDRPEIETITELLDDFLSVSAGIYTDGLSRSICMLAVIRPNISLKVRLRRVQSGPELGMAIRAQKIVDEEVASDSDCSRCLGDNRRCKCFLDGRQERNRNREERRAYLLSLQDGLLPIPVVY